MKEIERAKMGIRIQLKYQDSNPRKRILQKKGHGQRKICWGNQREGML